jgi:hypothetical protein
MMGPMYVYVIDKEEVIETDKAAHDFSESCKCSVYARHLVLSVRGRPNIDLINSIRGVFDSWFTGELHIVFNPLETTIEDLAKELFRAGLEPVLHVEEDVKYILN